MATTNSETFILDGRAVANEVHKRIINEINLIKSKNLRVPGLAVILVGENPASYTYVKNKEKISKKIGIYSEVHHLPSNTSEPELLKLIEALNFDKNIDGILVQLPLPIHLKQEKIINSINPEKDVDGLHPDNLGKLLSNQKSLIPCTPKGVIEILKHYSINVSGLHAVIVGRSTLVGKPLSILLLQNNATVTISHSKSNSLQEITRSADILISAIGKPRLINKNWIKPGSVIIDVGINKIYENSKERLVGDIDFESVVSLCHAITPVPGGVGPVTIAMLMSNTLESYKTRESIND